MSTQNWIDVVQCMAIAVLAIGLILHQTRGAQ